MTNLVANSLHHSLSPFSLNKFKNATHWKMQKNDRIVVSGFR
jgi:hypothetical protein